MATYTIDGSGSGGGTYNYIRDIKDFSDLATTKAIKFDTKSKTQQLWEEGLGFFYNSHYSRALQDFQQVKTLYPNHAKADEFIAAAQTRIANGQDVVDFPWWIVEIAAGVILLAGAGVTVLLIVRHKKHHSAYQAGVAQGTVQPIVPGVSPQKVVVTPGVPTVQPSTPAVAPPPASDAALVATTDSTSSSFLSRPSCVARLPV